MYFPSQIHVPSHSVTPVVQFWTKSFQLHLTQLNVCQENKLSWTLRLMCGNLHLLHKKQQIMVHFNILREFNILKKWCVRPEGGEGGERLGKIILSCSPSRLGAIINKPPEAAFQTRTGKQQRTHPKRSSLPLMLTFHKLISQSVSTKKPWFLSLPDLKKDIHHGGQMALHIQTHRGATPTWLDPEA